MENDYEVLDFGNINDLEKKLKKANDEIIRLNNENNNYNNKLNEYSKELKSLKIRHIILKAQSKKIITDTKYVDGKIITTTKSFQ